MNILINIATLISIAVSSFSTSYTFFKAKYEKEIWGGLKQLR